MAGLVYAVTADGTDLVKVGFTTRLRERLVSYQSNSPLPIRVIWQAPGDLWLEKFLRTNLGVPARYQEWHDFGERDAVQVLEALYERRPATPDFASLGPSLRERRESLGLTQKALARRAGVSQGAVSHLEHGRGLLAQTDLDRLMAALDPAEEAPPIAARVNPYCVAPGCSRVANGARGMCWPHYRRAQRDGTLPPLLSRTSNAPARWGGTKVCSVVDCRRLMYSRGVCRQHLELMDAEEAAS